MSNERDPKRQGGRLGRASRAIGAAAGVMLIGATSVAQDVCWDNDIVPNGFNARATSPPLFPSILVVSEVTVPAQGIEAVALRTVNVEDADWVPELPVQVYLYEDDGECPGALLASFETSDVTREFQEYRLFDRDVYEYWIRFDPLGLETGTYHIGSRWPNAGGAGTSYWLTSNGRDGSDRTDCFSITSGTTWLNMGDGWHMAFELQCSGNPAVTGACCLDDGACRVVSAGVCAALDGLYRGEGVACDDADCPAQLTGACCFPDESCAVLTDEACLDGDGTYQGHGVPCEESDCAPVPSGACCFPDGSCEILTESFCGDVGGTYEGDDVSCQDASCPWSPGRAGTTAS